MNDKQFLLEDEAKEQAKRLGLKYNGFGYWVDHSGQRVAKTVNSKLVRLDKNKSIGGYGPEHRDHIPHSSEIPAPDDNSQPDVEPQLQKVASSYDESARPDLGTRDANNQQYRNSSFWNEPPSAMRDGFWQIIDSRPSMEEFCEKMADLMQLSPTVKKVSFNESLGGARGDYILHSEQVRLDRVKSVPSLKRFLTYAPNHIRQAFDSKSNMNPSIRNSIRKDAMAVHTLIHEYVHSKDPFLARTNGYNLQFNIDAMMHGENAVVSIVEGLTETKARSITHGFLSELGIDDEAWYSDKGNSMGHAYETEQKVIATLDVMRDGTSAAMWRAHNHGERQTLITAAIDTGFDELNRIVSENSDDATINCVARCQYMLKQKQLKAFKHKEVDYGTTVVENGKEYHVYVPGVMQKIHTLFKTLTLSDSDFAKSMVIEELLPNIEQTLNSL